MNTYKVKITKVLETIIDIPISGANDESIAVSLAMQKYQNGDVILNEDSDKVTFVCLTHKSEFCKHKNLEDTGYGKFENGELDREYRCLECGKNIYKKE